MMMADLKQFLRMMMSSQALALVVHISGSRVEFHWGNISCLVFISLVLFKLALINLKPCILHIRCIPSKSTATIKLELLPLTDGTITLDSLQIDVKEKGMNRCIWMIFFLVRKIYVCVRFTQCGAGLSAFMQCNIL
jgi:hypothetical protein